MQLTGNVQGMLDFIGGGVKDVKVDDVSVVNEDGVAEINLPDAPVQGVEVDGVSVVNEDGVAEINLPDAPVQGVEVDGVSVVNEDGVAEITIPNTKLFIDTTNIIASFNTSQLSTLSNYEITDDCYATFRITPRTGTGLYVMIDNVYVISTWYEVYSTRWYGLYLKKGQKLTVNATPYDSNNDRFECDLYSLC